MWPRTPACIRAPASVWDLACDRPRSFTVNIIGWCSWFVTWEVLSVCWWSASDSIQCLSRLCWQQNRSPGHTVQRQQPAWIFLCCWIYQCAPYDVLFLLSCIILLSDGSNWPLSVFCQSIYPMVAVCLIQAVNLNKGVGKRKLTWIFPRVGETGVQICTL